MTSNEYSKPRFSMKFYEPRDVLYLALLLIAFAISVGTAGLMSRTPNTLAHCCKSNDSVCTPATTVFLQNIAMRKHDLKGMAAGTPIFLFFTTLLHGLSINYPKYITSKLYMSYHVFAYSIMSVFVSSILSAIYYIKCDDGFDVDAVRGLCTYMLVHLFISAIYEAWGASKRYTEYTKSTYRVQPDQLKEELL